MKINQALINKIYSNKVGVTDHKKSNNAKGTGDTVNLSTIKHDKIVMSPEALSAQTAAKASKAVVEELNEDYGDHQIAALKEAIQNGTYKIDSEKIAQAMVNYARFLGGNDE